METLGTLKPTLWVGKDGLKEGQIGNIKDHLKKHTYIKVKIQKSSRDQLDELISQILSQTNTELVQKIGFTFTLKKKKR